MWLFTYIADFMTGKIGGSIANLASMTSLLVSVFVAFKVREISRGFLFRARIPELIKTLKAQTRELVKHLDSVDENRGDIQAVLGRCKAAIESTREKLPRDYLSKSDETISRITRAQTKMNTESCWAAHSAIVEFQARIEELKKDVDRSGSQ